MTEPAIVLEALLADGPCNSRAVLAAMAERGFTAKQVRRAREQQGVVVRRSGSGAAMRSAWEWPSAAAPDGREQLPVGAQGGKASVRAHAASAPDPQGSTGGAGEDGLEDDRHRHPDEPACDLSEAELARLDGRITAFVSRGLGADEARSVAVGLVTRDRGNVPAVGSCIECQALERHECPVVPRPAAEIHQCWYRRIASP